MDAMTAMKQKYGVPEGLTLEKVWEQFYASDLRYEQRQAEFEREHRQRQAEFDKKWAKTSAELDKTVEAMKAGNKRLGGLENSLGEIVEHLVAPGIEERFRKLGMDFELTSRNVRLKEGREDIAEIDIVLENGESMLAVEVKSKPHVGDAERHVQRLEKLREYHARRGDTRRIYGAIAGAAFGAEEKKAALDAGLYVMVQSGDTMRLGVPRGFKPKVW